MKKNFIPIANNNPSNNYCCTWNTQNFGRYDAKNETDVEIFLDTEGAKKTRNFLNEEHLTDKCGLLNQYDSVRSELWFLLDDGWDIPYGVHPDAYVSRFGSLEVSTDRFPTCTGKPAERLKKLNSIVKKAGWRGLGIWVASQAAGETYGKLFSDSESEEYWKQRLIWSDYADIGYWKIDWGCHRFDIKWHRMLDKLAKAYAPRLIIEHSYPCEFPLNNVRFSGDNQITDGRYLSDTEFSDDWKTMAKDSAVFRTYDVVAQLSQVTTLDRVAAMLKNLNGSDCILNCEDEVYLAAGLGLLMGVMRSGMNKKIPIFNFDPQNVSNRLIEVERAVRWQRIAPAYSCLDSKLYLSDDILDETYFFENNDTWFGNAIGKKITQACPYVVCRGVNPEIIYNEEEKPIFVASRNPNGAISMATFPRLYGKNIYKTPLCTPVFNNLDTGAPIGIFGFYHSVVLKYNESVIGYSVWVQDLSKNEAVCVDNEVTIRDNRIEIPGELLSRICLCSDESEPGALVILELK